MIFNRRHVILLVLIVSSVTQSQLALSYERRCDEYFMAMAPEEHSPFKCEAIFQCVCQSEVFNRCKTHRLYCLWKYKKLEIQLKYSLHGQHTSQWGWESRGGWSVFIQIFPFFFFHFLLLPIKASSTFIVHDWSKCLCFCIFQFGANVSQYLTSP